MNGDLIDRLIDDWTRERPNIDASAMGVVGRVLRLGRILEARANRMLRAHGLVYTDFDVLATLRRSGEPYSLTPSILRQSALITSGAMTAALNRLKAARLITSNHHETDKRARAITLTDRGRALVDDLIDARFADAHAVIAGLGVRDAASLARLLRRLSLSLEAEAG
jgi:DNA-binding MarR family transcriptional regulator